MKTCIQCGKPCRFWGRDLLTGLCSKCHTEPGPAGLQTRERRLRKAAIVLRGVAISVLVITFAGVFYCTPLLDALFFDEPFSSEKWLTGDERTRGRMVRDLLKSGLLHGKTVAEIEKILGPGDVSHGDYIGPTPGYRVDIGYRWLIRPVLYTLWVDRPMSKFFEETTEVSVRAAGMISDWHPFSSRRPRSLTICCT